MVLLKKSGQTHKGLAGLPCYTGLVTCQGGDWEGDEQRKGERGRKMGIGHGSLQASCVCLVMSVFVLWGRENLHIMPCFLWHIFLNYKKKNRPNRVFFLEIASEENGASYILKIQLENRDRRFNRAKIPPVVLSVFICMWLFSPTECKPASEPSVHWPHCRKHFQMFVCFFCPSPTAPACFSPEEAAIHQKPSRTTFSSDRELITQRWSHNPERRSKVWERDLDQKLH